MAISWVQRALAGELPPKDFTALIITPDDPDFVDHPADATYLGAIDARLDALLGDDWCDGCKGPCIG